MKTLSYNPKATVEEIYGITYDGIRYNCHDLLNRLSAMEGHKVERAIKSILDLCKNGARYSHQDFDVLSYALAVCEGNG